MTDADKVCLMNLMQEIHQDAKAKGWWESERSPLEAIALIHSELSEAVEAARNHFPESEKLPGIGNFEEELADAVIRIFDYCGHLDLPLAAAIQRKIEYNRTRPHRRGGKAY